MSDAYGLGYMTEEQRLGIEPVGQDPGFELPDEVLATNGVVDHEDGPNEPQDDDLWAVDHEADEQTLKDALPPQGDYEVLLQAGPRTQKEVDGRNLPEQRYFGIGVRFVDGEPCKARIRLSLCPKKYIKSNGKTHWAYLTYIGARKAYRQFYKITDATDTRPSYDELEEYLTNNIVKVYVGHTKSNDYMAKDIKPSYSEIPF